MKWQPKTFKGRQVTIQKVVLGVTKEDCGVMQKVHGKGGRKTEDYATAIQNINQFTKKCF